MLSDALPARLNRIACLALTAALAACSTPGTPVRETPVARAPQASVASTSTAAQSTATPPQRAGAYYQDDGPPDQVPPGLLELPDAEPKVEPFLRGPSKPYTVFDQTYVPITDLRPFVQRGPGSWYGRKYHGRKTASGELYDMFAMSAAHPILPIPSYARVTHLRNGKQVIVRINDRGPFLGSRIIDLSYAAALKLDMLRVGSAELEVERLLPDEIARLQAAKRSTSNVSRGQPAPEDPIAALLSSAALNDSLSTANEPAFDLQLGAYSDEANARRMRDRLLPTWPSDLPPIEIIQSGTWYRLRSGPFPNRAVAADAARQLQSNAQIESAVVQR